MGLWDSRKLSENYIFCVCARLPETLCKFTDSFKRKWKSFKRYRDLSSSFHCRMTFHSVFQLFSFLFFPKCSWKGKKKKNKGLCVNLSGTILLKKTPMYMSIKKGFSNVRKQLNPETKDEFFVFSFFFFFKHELSWLV